ncbi:MAG: PEP-CTERM sorting domain-containing protein [Planctomycetales bacterium]
MSMSVKWCGALLVAAVLQLAIANSASAGLAFQGSLSDWLANTDPVVNGDKDFQALDASAELQVVNPSVSIATVGTNYTVTFGFDVGGLDGPFTGWIKYSVTITDPNWVFDVTHIDSTHLGSGSSSVQKDIDWGGPGVDVSITSLNGTTDTTSAAAGQTVLVITDYVTIDGSSNVASFVNTFTQKPVDTPEPTTVAMLLGLGLVGLCGRGRKQGV